MSRRYAPHIVLLGHLEDAARKDRSLTLYDLAAKVHGTYPDDTPERIRQYFLRRRPPREWLRNRDAIIEESRDGHRRRLQLRLRRGFATRAHVIPELPGLHIDGDDIPTTEPPRVLANMSRRYTDGVGMWVMFKPTPEGEAMLAPHLNLGTVREPSPDGTVYVCRAPGAAP